jgi:hypothetical protein
MNSDLFEFSKNHWLLIQHASGVEQNIAELFRIDGGIAFLGLLWRGPDVRRMNIIRGLIERSVVEPDTWIIEEIDHNGECSIVRELTKGKRILWNERTAWETLRHSAGAKWSHYQGHQMDFCKQMRFATEGAWYESK